MTVRSLPTSPLLLGLLLAGCIVPPPPEEEPTDPGKPGPSEPSSFPPVRLVLPPALWESVGYVSVTRLQEGAPAQEYVTAVPGGAQGFMANVAEAGDVVGLSALDKAGRWMGATTVRVTEDMDGPRPAIEPEVHEVPREYATLQAAVDAARSGDTVRVAPGTYTETVKLKSGIRLLGSGAPWTILDGGGQPVKLVDFSRARDVVVAGFTFQNVGMPTSGCARPEDVMLCSGDWYAAAVYGSSSAAGPGEVEASGLVTHNVFRQNHIGVLLHYRAPALVRNNVFLDNTNALVANHYASEVALVANNVFWGNTRYAIVSQAAYLHLWDNVIARSAVGVHHRHVQTGDIRCNVFFENGVNGSDDHGPSRVQLGVDGNVEVDPRFESPEAGDFHPRSGSPLLNAGCFGREGAVPGLRHPHIGAYGGALGRW